MKAKFAKVLALALCLILTLTATAFADNAVKFNAGVYTETVNAHNGQMTVEVTFSENAITDIKVLDHVESRELGTVAMDQVSAEILDRQSLAVDMVSGATISGAALRYAVQLAVKDAGADAQALYIEKEPDTTVYEDATCDLVIVGSGTAGMVAAAQAGELGLNAILVEQLGLLGGSSMRTGYITGADTKLQAEKGIVYTEEEIVADLTEQKTSMSAETYDPVIGEKIARQAGHNVDWLADVVGVEFGEIQYNTNFRGEGLARLGPWLIGGIHNYLDKIGVEYRLNTRATEIVMQDGAVAGVKVISPNGSEYVIHTKNVVLVTGGFFASQEMVNEYNPAFAGYPTDVCIGADGSGMKMAEAVGGVLVAMDQANYHGCATTYNGASRSLQTCLNNGAIIVNADGKRFVDEKQPYEVVAFSLLDQEGGCGYLIMDEPMVNYPAVVNDVGLACIMDMYEKADTLDELAAILGVDAEALKATVAEYSEYVHNGSDDAFGKQAKYLTSDYLTPPYYGVKATPETHTVAGGVKVDASCRVVDKDGAAIPGLYAAGEVSLTPLCGGSTNTLCVYMGRVSVQDIANNL